MPGIPFVWAGYKPAQIARCATKGGAKATEAAPGETRGFEFKALNPGLYVYHCATPTVASHIANGMYGLILVEPEEGLPKVDHEFYVMQGEIYTQRPFGQHGPHEFSLEKLLAERAEYVLFDGAVGACALHGVQIDTQRSGELAC